MEKIKSVCVYCGSQAGNNPNYRKLASELGEAFAKFGITLLYGGGDRGLMGAISDSVRSNGGNVIGIMPEFLINYEVDDDNIEKFGDIIVTQTMHERKTKLFEQADAFIAMPGGFGTLEELAEVTTWAQLRQHQKPIILANFEGFWQPLINLIQHMRNEGFIYNLDRFAPVVADNIEQILSLLGYH